MSASRERRRSWKSSTRFIRFRLVGVEDAAASSASVSSERGSSAGEAEARFMEKLSLNMVVLGRTSSLKGGTFCEQKIQCTLPD